MKLHSKLGSCLRINTKILGRLNARGVNGAAHSQKTGWRLTLAAACFSADIARCAVGKRSWLLGLVYLQYLTST